MSVLYDREADTEYRFAMAQAIAVIRDYASKNTPDRIEPELARAIWLAIPAVRFGKDIGHEGLNHQIQLDLVAAHEYGGHHGFSAERIEDEADHIVGLWFMDQDS